MRTKLFVYQCYLFTKAFVHQCFPLTKVFVYQTISFNNHLFTESVCLPNICLLTNMFVYQAHAVYHFCLFTKDYQSIVFVYQSVYEQPDGPVCLPSCRVCFVYELVCFYKHFRNMRPQHCQKVKTTMSTRTCVQMFENIRPVLLGGPWTFSSTSQALGL